MLIRTKETNNGKMVSLKLFNDFKSIKNVSLFINLK